MKPEPLYIGMGHRKGVGKSYFARKLLKQLSKTMPDKHVVILPFAETMKDFAAGIFIGSDLHCGGYYEEHPEEKSKPTLVGDDMLTPRKIWIKFANAMREIDEDVWINHVKYAAQDQGADIVIIPDVRFENEANFINDEGGLLIHIDAPGVAKDDDVDDVLEGSAVWDLRYVNDFKPKAMKQAAKDLAQIIEEDYFSDEN